MTTFLTQYVALTDDEWTPLAAADDYSAFGFQVSSGSPVALCIADGAPNANEDNYIVLSSKSPDFSEELPAGFTLYARALSGSAGVRGYRIPAA